jgi:hypothetical protein
MEPFDRELFENDFVNSVRRIDGVHEADVRRLFIVRCQTRRRMKTNISML